MKQNTKTNRTNAIFGLTKTLAMVAVLLGGSMGVKGQSVYGPIYVQNNTPLQYTMIFHMYDKCFGNEACAFPYKILPGQITTVSNPCPQSGIVFYGEIIHPITKVSLAKAYNFYGDCGHAIQMYANAPNFNCAQNIFGSVPIRTLTFSSEPTGFTGWFNACPSAVSGIGIPGSNYFIIQ
jgi:hypothetical protein